MSQDKYLSVTDLLINTENYRFETVGSQKEAIDLIVENQKIKIFRLAKDILENGLNPNERIMVTPSGSDKGKYVVLEGNRRTVALKLTLQPDLIDLDGYAGLKKKFKGLHEEGKGKHVKGADCIVYDTPADAERWIKLKHTGANEGVGTEGWNAQQVQRFDEKMGGKSPVAMQVIKLLSTSPEVPDDIKAKLPKLKVTNLDRLVSDPAFREFIGFDVQSGQVQSNVDKKEVMKGLVKVAKDLLNPNFKVNDIYTKDDRKKYMDGFLNAQRPNTKKMESKPWHVGSGPAQPYVRRASSKERRALIPRTCVLHISNPKVEAICGELRKLHVEEFTNGVAVLFRVFVELSMDCYRDDNKLTNKPSSSKDGTDLQAKVQQVADHLSTVGKADVHICQGIRTAVKNHNSLLGIVTWQGYLHNKNFSPIAKDLMTTWDNIQAFMEKVWASKP